MSPKLAFIGAGNMAEAIARGLLRSGKWAADQMTAADTSHERQTFFSTELGIKTIAAPAVAAQDASIVLLCVKPQQAVSVLKTIATAFASDSLLISIAAGIRCSVLESTLTTRATPQPRVVRTMPNTPMLVGQGAVAISAGTHATADDLAVARSLFETAARVVELDESKLDAVTAVSGSGPAYVFYLTELMTAAGQKVGLTVEDAATLARQTVIGAARMLVETSDSPELLRQRVTSPNGTTHAAIETMKAMKLDELIVAAITAAADRSKELSAGL